MVHGIVAQSGGAVSVSALLAARPDLRVIFTSGYTDDAKAIRELAARGSRFLPKPCTMQTLAEAVLAAVG